MTDQSKIQKMDSKTSIGFPEVGSNDKKPISEIIEREELMANVCHLLIYCERHEKICVSKVVSKGLCLPSIGMHHNGSLTMTASELLTNIGLKFDAFKSWMKGLINIWRIEITQTSNFITRFTFFVRIPKEPKQSKCCLSDEKYLWTEVRNVVQSASDFFWGPEVQVWTKFWIQNEDIKNIKKRNEYDTKDALKDYCDHPTICTTNEQIMIRSACFSEKDILRVYDLFFQHCFPSQFMTFTSFKLFIKKVGLKISENNLIATFRAFDSRQKAYINFNKTLLGLAAMDQATQHGGQSGQIRCTFLMRFYDSDSDGFLSHSDLCRMIVDIQKLSNSPHKEIYDSKKSSVEEYANQILKAHGTKNRISLTEFTKAVGSLKLRGTSGLFRAPGSTMKHIIKLYANEKSNLMSVTLVRHNKYENCCEFCRKRTYKISRMTYKMSKSGESLGFEDLNKFYPKISMNFPTDLPNMETMNLATEMINKIHEIKRRRFDKGPDRDKTAINNWFYPSKQVLIKRLLNVCDKAKQMFESEERVLRISTPCYIFGDIHGNLKDLMIFANDFWRMSPLLGESNYLFLGDYVDRGAFGVECITYLLVHKLMAPKTFWMCRGNHEVRSLQEQFTFMNECLDGYSEELWKAMNEVFDRLPIAAVVENKLFCCHGGIPRSTNSIEVLQTTPTVLADPQTESAPVWEILWNDPMSDQEFRQLTSFDRKELQDLDGFLPNIKRGTAFYYSEEAVTKFLENNDKQYIIRGHEANNMGYKFSMNGKVITIFSTSSYCTMNNEAAILFVNRNKIRVIRVNTFE